MLHLEEMLGREDDTSEVNVAFSTPGADAETQRDGCQGSPGAAGWMHPAPRHEAKRPREATAAVSPRGKGKGGRRMWEPRVHLSVHPSPESGSIPKSRVRHSPGASRVGHVGVQCCPD